MNVFLMAALATAIIYLGWRLEKIQRLVEDIAERQRIAAQRGGMPLLPEENWQAAADAVAQADTILKDAGVDRRKAP